jgi:hypothetical protein
MNSYAAQLLIRGLEERGLLEIEQRDPNYQHARNYYVVPQALEGHTEACEEAFAAKSISKMLELTSDATGVADHVVPPSEEPLPKTERELLVKHIGAFGIQRGWQDEDYHRAYNRIYAHLATLGYEVRGKRNPKTGAKVKPLDVVEARGLAGKALDIAREFYPTMVQQRLGHA